MSLVVLSEFLLATDFVLLAAFGQGVVFLL